MTLPGKISVCIPTFNGEKYLEECLNSVLNQTTSDFEVIVSDDCSTDSTCRIIESYQRKDNRIKLHRNNLRLGLYNNFNRCMDLAGGSYLKILGQDDRLEPHALELKADILENAPEVVLVSSARRHVDRDGRLLEVRPGYKPGETISGKQAIKENLVAMQNLIGNPSTVLFRVSSVSSPFDARYFAYGDIDFWHQLLLKGKYYSLDRQLCSVRIHEQSATALFRDSLAFLADILLIREKYPGLANKLGLSPDRWNRVIDEHVTKCSVGLHAEGLLDPEKVTSACLNLSSYAGDTKHVIEAMARLSAYGVKAVQELHRTAYRVPETDQNSKKNVMRLADKLVSSAESPC